MKITRLTKTRKARMILRSWAPFWWQRRRSATYRKRVTTRSPAWIITLEGWLALCICFAAVALAVFAWDLAT